MSKAEKNTASLFVPDDSSYEYEEEAIKQNLQNAGFPNDDQEWLVQLFKRPDTFGDPSGTFVFRENFEDDLKSALRIVKGKVQIGKACQTALALLFSSMLGFEPINSLRPNDELDKSSDSSDIPDPEWIREFQNHARFCAKSLNWGKLVEISKFDDLVPCLFPESVPLNQVVDLNLLNPIQRSRYSSNDFEDPKQLEFWLIWRFEDDEKRRDIIRLNTLLQPFSDFPEDVLGKKILGLRNAIHYAMSVIPRSLVRLDPLNDGWRVVAHELLLFLGLLNAKEPDSSQERSSLLRAWWRLAKVIYGWDMGGLEAELSTDLRNRLVESAARHIGILRSVLRDTPKDFKDEDSAGTVPGFYEDAFHILLTLASPWKCLKPLLLAFTQMTVQAVTSDLRAWPEYGEEEKLPYPYSSVALWIAITMYPQNLRKELDSDPYLQGLREELAKFCLGCLKTKKKKEASSADKQSYTDEDFIEHRPLWRQGYVQALAALRVNPGGRAHRTLFWLSQNDPDETTRALAKRAHKQIRHLDRKKHNIDVGSSPRRPLFEAFWWLRQAHLVTLEKEVDQAGAMRTRRKELHRTRERDDFRNWGRTR